MDNPSWLLTKYFRICVNINLSSTTSWRWSCSVKLSQFVFPPHPLNLKYYLPPPNFMHIESEQCITNFGVFIYLYFHTKKQQLKKNVIHDNKTLWRNSKKRVTLNVSREPNTDCWDHLFTSQMICYLPVNPTQVHTDIYVVFSCILRFTSLIQTTSVTLIN